MSGWKIRGGRAHCSRSVFLANRVVREDRRADGQSAFLYPAIAQQLDRLHARQAVETGKGILGRKSVLAPSADLSGLCVEALGLFSLVTRHLGIECGVELGGDGAG